MSTKPWMLKQVTDEERNAAILAAKKAGEPIGRWCGRKLFEAAQAELSPSKKQVARTGQERALAVQEDTAHQQILATLVGSPAGADAILKLAEAADKLAKLPPDIPNVASLRSAGLRLVRDQLRAQRD